jgi:hypothetical protein
MLGSVIILSWFYSYRNASIGCILAALRAGYQPKIIPIPAETAKARRIEFVERTKADFDKVEYK